MDWKNWIGKKVFVQLRSGGYYTGEVVDVDDTAHPSIFITIIDKFGETISFVQSEIIKIKEEKNGGNKKRFI